MARDGQRWPEMEHLEHRCFQLEMSEYVPWKEICRATKSPKISQASLQRSLEIKDCKMSPRHVDYVPVPGKVGSYEKEKAWQTRQTRQRLRCSKMFQDFPITVVIRTMDWKAQWIPLTWLRCLCFVEQDRNRVEMFCCFFMYHMILICLQ
jgi:hypothetical protein